MITGMPRIAIAVRDFPTTVATFRDKLGMPVIDMSEGSVESLGAKLAMCVPSRLLKNSSSKGTFEGSPKGEM